MYKRAEYQVIENFVNGHHNDFYDVIDYHYIKNFFLSIIIDFR